MSGKHRKCFLYPHHRILLKRSEMVVPSIPINQERSETGVLRGVLEDKLHGLKLWDPFFGSQEEEEVDDVFLQARGEDS